MTVSTATGGRSRSLILAAVIFDVAMTFIDQAIVSIAVPNIQRELGLTSTGVQWMVNAYLLSLSALFAFGGRLAGTLGHRKMVTPAFVRGQPERVTEVVPVERRPMLKTTKCAKHGRRSAWQTTFILEANDVLTLTPSAFALRGPYSSASQEVA
jgi:hypothetical protein